MNPSALAALIALLTVAGSFIYACVRFGLVVGRFSGKMSTIADGLAGLTDVLRESSRRWDDLLDEHGQRITRVETHLGITVDRRRSINRREEDQ